MSEGGHYNECVLVGRVASLCRAPNGTTRGVMLLVDAGEPALIPILAATCPRVAKGTRLWVRGSLQTVPEPGQRYPLLAVVARVIEVVAIHRAEEQTHVHHG